MIYSLPTRLVVDVLHAHKAKPNKDVCLWGFSFGFVNICSLHVEFGFTQLTTGGGIYGIKIYDKGRENKSVSVFVNEDEAIRFVSEINPEKGNVTCWMEYKGSKSLLIIYPLRRKFKWVKGFQVPFHYRRLVTDIHAEKL